MKRLNQHTMAAKCKHVLEELVGSKLLSTNLIACNIAKPIPNRIFNSFLP